MFMVAGSKSGDGCPPTAMAEPAASSFGFGKMEGAKPKGACGAPNAFAKGRFAAALELARPPWMRQQSCLGLATFLAARKAQQ